MTKILFTGLALKMLKVLKIVDLRLFLKRFFQRRMEVFSSTILNGSQNLSYIYEIDLLSCELCVCYLMI